MSLSMSMGGMRTKLVCARATERARSSLAHRLAHRLPDDFYVMICTDKKRLQTIDYPLETALPVK